MPAFSVRQGYDSPIVIWATLSYRRLWLSVLTSCFGTHIGSLALSLTSAMLLHATPSQIGILGAMGTAPFILFSVPAGVWLDRVRKLPVYIAGELVMAVTLASVALALSLDYLTMGYLYGVTFIGGCVSVISGTAGQIVLTQVVPREQLVEAHSKNNLAASLAEITGPGTAGIMIKLFGATVALWCNGVLLLFSVMLLRGIDVVEAPPDKCETHFWRNMKEGVSFVLGHRLLMTIAVVVGLWQICQTCAMVVQVLFATRDLGLNEYQYGLCFSVAALGTVAASTLGHRLSRRIGPGPAMISGMALSGLGWLQLALAPADAWGVVAFIVMLLSFSASSVLLFSNMLAVRQAITPEALLGRMTGTMRFMTLLPAGPGALLGGFLGEHFGLRSAIGLGGCGALLLAFVVWRYTLIRHVKKVGVQI